MKNLLLVTTLLCSSLSALANPILIKSDGGSFQGWGSSLLKDFESIDRELRIYMEDNLKCKNVRPELEIVREDGLISRGLSRVILKADCPGFIRFTKIEFDPSCKKSDVTFLMLYSKYSKYSSKRFTVHNSNICRD